MPNSNAITIVHTCDLGEFGELDLTFTGRFYPGSPATGLSGRPEDYDPGSDPELDIKEVTCEYAPGLNLTKLFSQFATEDLLEDLLQQAIDQSEHFNEPEGYEDD